MIIGTGIDIIEVERVRQALRRRGEPLLARIWTPAEQAFGRGTPGWFESLAGRFAAKEAVLKALGSGLREASWREVEVLREPWSAPRVRLSGRAAERAARLDVQRWHLSISHSRGYAVAVAIAEAADGPRATGEGDPS
ncbi:MAG: holo-ACP synthase [Bacillota bacterium]|nr:holo-ACP synthase [Bacillota bacterium]